MSFRPDSPLNRLVILWPGVPIAACALGFVLAVIEISETHSGSFAALAIAMGCGLAFSLGPVGQRTRECRVAGRLKADLQTQLKTPPPAPPRNGEVRSVLLPLPASGRGSGGWVFLHVAFRLQQSHR